MEEFFKDFTGPQWVTSAIAVVALYLSALTAWRNRVPKPHWKFERFTDVMVDRRDDDGDVFEHLVGIAAVFKQVGPGTAESVEVLNDEKVWIKANRAKGLVERDNSVSVTIQAGKIKAGRYKIRIRYRCLPNTTRVRTFRKRVRLTDEKIADLLED